MHQLQAFYESIDPAGVMQPIAAVYDDTVTTNGDDMRVPPEMPFLLGEMAFINDVTVANRAAITAPSLRQFAAYEIAPIVEAAVMSNPPAADMHPMSPIQLVPDESMNFEVLSNPAAAAAHYGLVVMGDGALQPVQGAIYTVRATASITNVLGSWVAGALTLGEDLPIGNYNVVGMRVLEATSVAARLIFKGSASRPGCPCVADEDNLDVPYFRKGGLGIWGQFHTNTPPSLEILGAAGAVTPVVMLDLMAA